MGFGESGIRFSFLRSVLEETSGGENQASVVLRQLALLETLTVVSPDPPIVRRAVELNANFQLSFWDASILAAAESAGCRYPFSEDLHAGQAYGAIRVIDPFAG